LWHTVVGEHGDLVDIPKLSIALTLEAGPEIGNQNLGSFHDADWLAPPFKSVLVPETAEVTSQQVD
jgi:hypothetical protein